MAYRTIIVGTDGSATAEKAVLQAAGLAAQHGAQLIVVAAADPHGDELAGPTDELVGQAKRAALGVGAERVTVQASAGSPADILLEAATDFRADCIVVGSVGLTSAAHFVLGSVASSVAHHAPCDVLIVHTTDVDTKA
jgi:nucleotide-binding universal stress UspA family protein